MSNSTPPQATAAVLAQIAQEKGLSLEHFSVPASEVLVGDLLVDDRWPQFFGRTVIAVSSNEDVMSEDHGQLVAIVLMGHCSVAAREGVWFDVLRQHVQSEDAATVRHAAVVLRAIDVWLASPQPDRNRVEGIRHVLNDPAYAVEIAGRREVKYAETEG